MRRGVAQCVLLAGVALGLGSALACGNDSSASTTPTFTETTDTVNGTIAPLGTSVQTFVVNYTAGTSDASITITNLATVANNTPVNITLGVGFGQLNVGACTLVASLTNPTAPLNTELPTQGAPFSAGQYCVEIFDNPNAPTVTQPLNYTLAIKHF